MDRPADLSRRRFLAGRLRSAPPPLRPPWLSEAALARCSGCSACADTCPTGIVSMLEGRPAVSFATGECTFCGLCAQACPEQLFDRAGPAFTHQAAIGADCLARAGIVCQSCRDACPEAAIRFVPRLGGPFLPEVRAEACTGCGACVGVCPTAAVAMERMPENLDA